MIKKLIAVISMLLASQTFAQTQVVWPFSAGSNQANVVRAVISNVNAANNTAYVFTHKPGAGGTIGVNHVAGLTPPGFLVTSSSYFIRPTLVKEGAHSADRLIPVMMVSQGQPMAVISRKFASIDQVGRQKQLSIGVNLGTISQLMAETLKQNFPGLELNLVPYPGTIEITRDVIGGHLDLGLEFLNDVEQHVQANTVNVLGISGKVSKNNYKTLSGQGLKGFDDLLIDYWVLTADSTGADVIETFRRQWQPEVVKAEIATLWVKDGVSVPQILNMAETKKKFDQQNKFWQSIGERIGKK